MSTALAAPVCFKKKHLRDKACLVHASRGLQTFLKHFSLACVSGIRHFVVGVWHVCWLRLKRFDNFISAHRLSIIIYCSEHSV